MPKNQGIVLFYTARALGLIVKPLTLWYLVRIQAHDVSHFVATYYFLVAATFIALNSEAHIPFFKLRFGGNNPDVVRLGIAFRSYVMAFSSHIFVFLPFVFIGFLLYLENFTEAFAFSVLVLLEKLWDEIQRSLIFSRRYVTWSFWFIVKMIVPTLAIAIAYWQQWNMFICVCLSLLAVSGAMSYKLVPRKELLVIIHAAKQTLGRSLGEYFQTYKQRFALAQLLAVSSTNLLNVDKWLVGVVGLERLLVDLVLLSQFGTIYLVLMDNVFFSRNRDCYVLSKERIADIIHWPKLLWVSSGYLFGALAVLFFFREFFGILQLSIEQIALIISCFVMVGVTRPLTEHAFWHSPRSHSAWIDCSSILIMLAMGYLAVQKGGLILMLYMNLTILLIRFSSYAFVCKKTCIATTQAQKDHQ